MLRRYVMLCAPVFLCLSGGAQAACYLKGIFQFGIPGTLHAYVDSGGRCHYKLPAFGTFNSLSITSTASNGKVRPLNSYSFAYIPKPGFKGQDRFVVTVDGTGPHTHGVSELTINVDVR